MYDETSEKLARSLSYALFVNGAEMSLGEFMEKLKDYGDARVREAGAYAQHLLATERRENEPTTTD